MISTKISIKTVASGAVKADLARLLKEEGRVDVRETECAELRQEGMRVLGD